MKKILLLTGIVISAFVINAQECTKLFISEYVEGSGQNKALEIYNPTNQVVSLDGYKIQRYANGSDIATHQIEIVLNEGPNEIQPFDVIIVTNGQSEDTGHGLIDPELYDMADMHAPAIYDIDPMYFNGNDCVVLLDNNNIILDFFGVKGQDPSSEGNANGWCDVDSLDYQSGPYYWLSWTSDHTMIRKPEVQQGDTNPDDPFNTAIEWDTLPEDTWTDLGSHECDCNENSIFQLANTRDFELYPNPIQKGQQFNVFGEDIVTKVSVYNIVGQKSEEIIVSDRTGHVNVNTDNLLTGVYLVEVHFKDGIKAIRRLTVE